MISPSRVTVSRTTRAVTPLAISRVTAVAVTTTAHDLAVLGGLAVGPARARVEREPGVGHLGGELGGVELHWLVGLRRAPLDGAVGGLSRLLRRRFVAAAGEQRESAAGHGRDEGAHDVVSRRRRRRTRRGAVALGADDLEVRVELDVDLGAVVEGHLDLVLALLVVDLGPGDLAAAGLLERCLARPGRGRLRGWGARCASSSPAMATAPPTRAGGHHGGAGEHHGDALAVQLQVHVADATSAR